MNSLERIPSAKLFPEPDPTLTLYSAKGLKLSGCALDVHRIVVVVHALLSFFIRRNFLTANAHENLALHVFFVFLRKTRGLTYFCAFAPEESRVNPALN